MKVEMNLLGIFDESQKRLAIIVRVSISEERFVDDIRHHNLHFFFEIFFDLQFSNLNRPSHIHMILVGSVAEALNIIRD